MNPRAAADLAYPYADSIPINRLRIGGTLSLGISPALLSLVARGQSKRSPWRPTTVKAILSN